MTYKQWFERLKTFDAELSDLWFLFCEITNKTKTEIILSFNEQIKKDDLDRLEEGTIRLVKDNYPPQYYLGYTYFYKRKFQVNHNVLIPRFDSEVLVETVLANVFNKLDLLELGVGSGALAITLKKEQPDLKIEATDISQPALELAKVNAALHQAQISFFLSDLFSNVKKTYDIIISNPPYIDPQEELSQKVYNYEPHLALFSPEFGLYHSKKIISEAKNYLNKDGILFLEIHAQQGLFLKSFAEKHFQTVEIKKDYNNHDRVLIARSKL